MIRPGDPIEVAQEHLRAGRVEQARKVLEAALARAPRDARINRNLGAVLARLKDATRAVYHVQRAVELEPGNAENLLTLADVLMQSSRRAEAAGVFERVIAIDPRRPEAYAGIAHARLFMDDTDGAAAAYERAVTAIPAEVELWRGYGSLLLRLCRHEEAAAVLRRGVAANPDRPEIDELLGYVLNYTAGTDEASAEEVAEVHRRFGRVVASHIRQSEPVWGNSREVGRVLRVGYISPDFRGHSCAHYIEPVLRHHDKASVEAFCYFTGDRADEVTQRLRPLAQWRDVSGVPVKMLAETIRRDGIDILVELSGHTAGNSLLGLVRRAAPIQMTYLGYPNTTGLAAIDYRIVDALTDPVSAGSAPGADALAVEKLIRLPGCFLCYQPPYPIKGEPLPEPGRDGEAGAGGADGAGTGRAGTGGAVTFGSFNMVQKINGPLVKLWARVMKEVDGSRLVLKCDTRLAAVRERLLGWFAAEGIGKERLELPAMTKGFGEHLAWYRRVDVALDTFPYNGTTTTCEAVWMGVPTVSLTGRVHASRVGLSLLTAIGMPELCAASEDEFVRIAVGLARDRGRVAELRGSLRGRLLGSELCDGVGFARKLEGAYRGVWEGWRR